MPRVLQIAISDFCCDLFGHLEWHRRTRFFGHRGLELADGKQKEQDWKSRKGGLDKKVSFSSLVSKIYLTQKKVQLIAGGPVFLALKMFRVLSTTRIHVLSTPLH